MKKIKLDDISVALENLEKGMGNKDKERPKIQVFSDYMDKNNKVELEVIPFGIKEVDDATNIGGLPRGRMIELFGPESGGKSYLSLKAIASAQRMNLRACLVDIEHSFMSDWATYVGVDVTKLLYGCDFDYGEQALEYITKMCISGLSDLIVIDSTVALIPKAELEGDLIDSNPGIMARMMSKAVRGIMDASSKSNTTVVWINQIREKLSIGKPSWGDSETTPGGRALKFYSHMRLRVVRVGKVYAAGNDSPDEKDVVATKSKVIVIKNKVAAPFGSAEFEIAAKKKVDPMTALIKMAYEVKAVSRKTKDDKKFFVIGKGSQQLETECEDFSSLSKWVIENKKLEDLIALTRELGLKKDVEAKTLDDIISAATLSLTTPKLEQGEESEVIENEEEKQQE